MPAPARNGHYGIVISGAGQTYTVQIDGQPGAVQCECQGVDPAETIPAGSYMLVVQLSTGYFGFPAVFLPDQS